MTVKEARAQFVRLFETTSVVLSQGSVGDYIRRAFLEKQTAQSIPLSDLIYDAQGKRGLEYCWRDYTEIAGKYGVYMMLLPYCAHPNTRSVPAELRDATADNFLHCRAIIDTYPGIREQILLGTSLRFSGDSYRPETGLNRERAYAFHRPLAERLERSCIVHARTGLMPSVEEAIGCARALSRTTLPYRVSLVIRNDGCVLDGTPLHDAVAKMDEALRDRPPLFYQGQCVHPNNMRKCLDRSFNRTALVRSRVLGLEGNGSELSPEELDGSCAIRSSKPEEWAQDMMRLHTDYGFRLLGGCCGTFHAHIEELAARVHDLPSASAVPQPDLQLSLASGLQ